MKYLVPINEFVSKENWVDFNLMNLDKYSLDRIWNLYKKIYLDENMDLSASGPKEFKRKYSNILVLYINDVEATGFITYKKTPYGNKIALLSSNKDKKSKSLLVSKMLELLNSRSENWYIEASNRIEEILKDSPVNVIRDESDIRKLIKKDLIMLDDGYYKRPLTKVDKYITKRIYGNIKDGSDKLYEYKEDNVDQTNGRTKELNEDEFLEILKTKCSDFYDRLKSGNYIPIYRGTDFDGEYGVISTKSHKREAAYANTTYLNLIDGAQSWKDFPKRRESIICSTDRQDASTFNKNLCITIPFNDAKFGVCPTLDFQWNSFREFNKIIGGEMYDMNRYLFSTSIKSINKVYSFDEIREKILSGDFNKKLLKKLFRSDESVDMEDYQSFYDRLINSIDPHKNGFELLDYNEIYDNISDSREVWTDSDCLLISEKSYHSLLRIINRKKL